jgi:predicted transcriptional regulator
MSEEQRRPAQLSVRLEDDLRVAVEQRARAERRSVSNLLAKLVADAIDRDQAAA